MQIHETKIPDVKIIVPHVHKDARGLFFESFNQKAFSQAINQTAEGSFDFVQDNHSANAKNVLRGLHYQLPPLAQAKLVRCVSGEVFDVAVDIRKSSPSFGHWVGDILSVENQKQLWIPRGFAHGFLSLSQEAVLLYKTDNYYSPSHERRIIWNDTDINIAWPLAAKTLPLLSEQDRQAGALKHADLFD